LPLCSQHLPTEVQEVLREMPLDPSCLEDIPYQTKIQVYDEKCSGCGFARIVLMNRRKGVDKFNIIIQSNNINEVLSQAKNLNDIIVRSCAYPDDICYTNNKPVYPSVSEIVANTCKFWRESKLFMFSEDEEKEFEQYKEGISEIEYI